MLYPLNLDTLHARLLAIVELLSGSENIRDLDALWQSKHRVRVRQPFILIAVQIDIDEQVLVETVYGAQNLRVRVDRENSFRDSLHLDDVKLGDVKLACHEVRPFESVKVLHSEGAAFFAQTKGSVRIVPFHGDAFDWQQAQLALDLGRGVDQIARILGDKLEFGEVLVRHLKEDEFEELGGVEDSRRGRVGGLHDVVVFDLGERVSEFTGRVFEVGVRSERLD